LPETAHQATIAVGALLKKRTLHAEGKAMAASDKHFYAYEIYDRSDMPLRTAPVNRDWMDQSDQRFAYRCLPLAIANQAGWLLHCPTTFTATWDGGLYKDSVRIQFGAAGGPQASGQIGFVNVVSFAVPAPAVHRDSRITSHFGSGTVTIAIPYLFRTPPGVNLWVKGPTNWIKDGAQALEGIVETDWLPATFTMNWKLTRPHYPVCFERGEPFCMVVPVTRGLAESLEPVFAPLRNEPELHQEYQEWQQSRLEFNKGLERRQPDAIQRGWQRDYVKGVTPKGVRAVEHQTRLQLKEFTPLSDAPPEST
jgi:hypothetical protein